REHIAAQVVNASISGETTAGGRARFPALLETHRPQVVVLELGAKDALRGLPLAITLDNHSEMVRQVEAARAQGLVVRMRLPPKYGRKYGEEFIALFAKVAKEQKAALVPFLLRGVADASNAEALFQPDGLHPREAAQPTMLGNVWPALKPLLVIG